MDKDKFEEELKRFFSEKLGADIEMHRIDVKPKKEMDPLDMIKDKFTQKLANAVIHDCVTLMQKVIRGREGELIEHKIADRKVVLRVIQPAER